MIFASLSRASRFVTHFFRPLPADFRLDISRKSLFPFAPGVSIAIWNDSMQKHQCQQESSIGRGRRSRTLIYRFGDGCSAIELYPCWW